MWNTLEGIWNWDSEKGKNAWPNRHRSCSLNESLNSGSPCGLSKKVQLWIGSREQSRGSIVTPETWNHYQLALANGGSTEKYPINFFFRFAGSSLFRSSRPSRTKKCGHLAVMLPVASSSKLVNLNLCKCSASGHIIYDVPLVAKLIWTKTFEFKKTFSTCLAVCL